MFHLVKILNGRVSVPEPQLITLKSETEAERGDLVQIASGNAIRITNLSPVLPTHYVLAKRSATALLAAAVTPEMIFEAELQGSPDDMTVGNEYLVSEDGDGMSASPAVSGKRGGILYDKLNAKKEGDTVLVRFKYYN